MSGKNVAAMPEVVTLNVNEILVDTAFNARKTAEWRNGEANRTPDDTARELAKSIKRDGQLTPVMVEKIAKPGKDGKKYYLIFGFQRMRAISGPKEDGFLGQTTIRATVTESTNETDRMYLNMVENVARADLSTYDLALRCYELSTKYGESGTKIAARLGKGVGYINNLIRIRTKCCKAVLDRWTKEVSPEWKGQGRVCTTDALVKWSSLNEGEQEAALAEAMGIQTTGTEGAGGEGASNGAANGEGKVKRPSPKVLKAAIATCTTEIAAAKERGAKQAQARFEGVREALQFALGLKANIRGIYEPAGAEGAESDDAEVVADQN